MFGDHEGLKERAGRYGPALATFGSRYRIAILLGALFVFSLCMAWAVDALHLNWRDLDWWQIVIAAALTPISIWLSGIELQLCARAAGGRIAIGPALAYSSTATVANLLPIPASVVVRGNALLQSGASLAMSSKIILAAGLLWFAIAATISTVAMSSTIGGFFISGLFVAMAVLVSLWIARRSGVGIAAGFVLVRAGLLAALVARLYFCFAAIQVPTTILDTAIYTLASILGSAVAIVPAGLGVAESIAGLLAKAVGASAAAAFLSLGLNRIIGLLGCGATALLFVARPAARTQTSDN